MAFATHIQIIVHSFLNFYLMSFIILANVRNDLCWSSTPGEGDNGIEFHPFVHSLSD